MKDFNRNYAATRLQGVMDMLRDAASVEEVENAIGHLHTVYTETVNSAQEAGLAV